MNERIQRVLRQERLESVDPPVLLESESNEVWRVGEAVVRICWRGDRDRLFREAQVARELPKQIGYPEILAVGRDTDVSWMVSRALPGVGVHTVLHEMDAAAKRQVGTRLGELLRIVHAAPVPVGLDERRGVDVTGEDVLPLPIPRARRLLQELTVGSKIDQADALAVAHRLDELEPLDPFATTGRLLHCDAGIENLLWDGTAVTSLIDFEWSRSGAPWVDLIGHMRYGDRDVAQGVRDAYPEPFDLPDVQRRLQLLELAAALRTLALYPGPPNVERLRAVTASGYDAGPRP